MHTFAACVKCMQVCHSHFTLAHSAFITIHDSNAWAARHHHHAHAWWMPQAKATDFFHTKIQGLDHQFLACSHTCTYVHMHGACESGFAEGNAYFEVLTHRFSAMHVALEVWLSSKCAGRWQACISHHNTVYHITLTVTRRSRDCLVTHAYLTYSRWRLRIMI